MPKARAANFTLRTIASKLTADRCTHRFLSFQRSGRYSEIRIIQKGKLFSIVAYKWPSKGPRRKYGIGRARVNPTPTKITPNQVTFGQHGKVKVGWIERETPTRYLVAYKIGPRLHTVWRRKDRVTFQATDKRGKVRNACLKTANPRHLDASLRLSEKFHGARPRTVRRQPIEWPKSLVHIGALAQLDYISDKYDGTLRQYFHEFEKPCSVFAGAIAQADGTNLLIVKGRFNIKADGIVG